MSGRILTIEDDPAVRAMLRTLLEDEGFDVSEAGDGAFGLEMVSREPIDLVLLDLRLPGMHGFDVCRELRSRSNVPIIVVSAREDTHDVVAALEMGADDYVTKPFVVRELMARIRAAARRSRTPVRDQLPTISLSGLEIRRSEGTVLVDGAPVSLTRTEYLLMCVLADRPGQVLSREQLLEQVWGYDYLGDSRLVDAHIGRLRAKIEADPSSPKRLVTLRGLGYKLTP